MILFAFSVVFIPKMIGISCLTVIFQRHFEIFYLFVKNEEGSQLSILKIYSQSLLQFDYKDIANFATCCWLVWYFCNKLCNEGRCSSGLLIVSQILHFVEEFSSLHGASSSISQLGPGLSPNRFWKPPDHGLLKVNMYVVFPNDKIDIGILIRNHLGTPIFARVVPH